MPDHYERFATSNKRNKDGHADKGSSRSGREIPRALRKHKFMSVSSGMPYEKRYEEQPESPFYDTCAPPTGNPPMTQKRPKAVRWKDQYMEPLVSTQDHQKMAQEQYMAPG